MQRSCTSCLHFKKVPGEMLVFCKMNKLPQLFQISKYEVSEGGLIELNHRELFDFAKECIMFVNTEDEVESTGGKCEDRHTFPVALG